jgi:hypothetical protein
MFRRNKIFGRMMTTPATMSRRDDTSFASKCRPVLDLEERLPLPFRRLKPTVNKVSSLRDFVLDFNRLRNMSDSIIQ